MADLYSRFVNFIQDEKLLEETNSVLVGVSGGVDSMTLLDLLVRYKQESEGICRLRVAHFNHSTRNGKSDLDEKMVRQFCQNKNIPFNVKKLDIPKIAQKSDKSFEMVAREKRYKYFNELVDEKEVIATGHTLDDHIETILLRVIKGTGLKGLTGISTQYRNRIRPLRFAQKTEIYKWAREHDLDFREDRTNFENHCLRNIIRNKIIPIIEKDINPGYEKSIQRIGKIACETEKHLKNKAAKIAEKVVYEYTSWYYSLECNKLQGLDRVVVKYILMDITRKLYPDSTIRYTEFKRFFSQLESENRGQLLKLTSRIWANFDRDSVIIYDRVKQNWSKTNLKPGEKVSTSTFKIKSELVEINQVELEGKNNIEYIDSQELNGKLTIRHWQAGDVFVPLGMNHPKKIADYFIDNKIPKCKKHHIPFIINNDEIVWICGERLSDKYKITRNTENVLKLKYIEK